MSLLSTFIILQWFSSGSLSMVSLYKFTSVFYLVSMCFVHLPCHRELNYRSICYILEFLFHLVFSFEYGHHSRFSLVWSPLFFLVLLYFRSLGMLKTDNGSVRLTAPLEPLLKSDENVSVLRIIMKTLHRFSTVLIISEMDEQHNLQWMRYHLVVWCFPERNSENYSMFSYIPWSRWPDYAVSLLQETVPVRHNRETLVTFWK